MNFITTVKQRFYLLLIPVLLAACMFSCTKGGDVSVDNKALIIGEWNLTHKTLKQISNGATIRQEPDVDIKGASYQFNTDNTLAVKTDAEHGFTMQYTLVGDSLTFIHTESQEYYGFKERFRVRKLTNTGLQLSYLPKDNEPYLEAPNGTYIEITLSK